jgi:hypothetical protein
MPTNLTDVSTFSSPVAVPASGDSRTAASVSTPFQSLANRTKYLYDALLNGVLVGGDGCYSSAGADVRVPALKVLIGSALLSTSAETTVALSGLTAGTFYYVYAYNNAGAVGFEVSATPPDAGLVYKNGGTTHRYICAVLATAATTVRPFRKAGRDYTWRVSAIASEGLTALRAQPGAGTGTYATVTLAHWSTAHPFMPAHARIAKLCARQERTGGTGALQMNFRTNGDTTSPLFFSNGATTGDDYVNITFELETNSSSQIQWSAVGGGATTTNVTVDVLGFRE